jgi:hypothetical protein
MARAICNQAIPRQRDGDYIEVDSCLSTRWEGRGDGSHCLTGGCRVRRGDRPPITLSCGDFWERGQRCDCVGIERATSGWALGLFLAVSDIRRPQRGEQRQ